MTPCPSAPGLALGLLLLSPDAAGSCSNYQDLLQQLRAHAELLQDHKKLLEPYVSDHWLRGEPSAPALGIRHYPHPNMERERAGVGENSPGDAGPGEAQRQCGFRPGRAPHAPAAPPSSQQNPASPLQAATSPESCCCSRLSG